MIINKAAKFQLIYSFMIGYTGMSLILNPNNFFNDTFMKYQSNFLNLEIMPLNQELSNRHFGIVVCVFSIFYFISGYFKNIFFIKMSIFTRFFYSIMCIVLCYINYVPQQWIIASVWDIITAFITLILLYKDNEFTNTKIKI